MEALILTGDHHTNSTVGLCTSRVTLDDGGTYSPNKTQRWMWAFWNECWQEAKAFTEEASRVTWIINGDMVDKDNKQRSYQYITGNPATIANMTIDTLAPGLEIADQVLVIRGSDVPSSSINMYVIMRLYPNAFAARHAAPYNIDAAFFVPSVQLRVTSNV